MRYYLVAGERSGDLHGGNLVKAIRRRDPEASFRGYGGDYMGNAGVEIAVHYNDIAVMGLVELLFSLQKFRKIIKECTADITQFQPDVIILIDYGGFNRRIARFGKEVGIRVFYYIPPKIWAWYQRRAEEIKRNVDRLFVILPFEKEFYRKFNWEVDYVGNPVLDAVNQHATHPEFIARFGRNGSQPIVALLPGSRKQELIRMTPTLVEVVKRHPSCRFLVAAVANLDKHLYKPYEALPNVTLLFDSTYDIFDCARAAVVTSGTATLETALFRVPQLVVYKTNELSYWLGKLLIKVKYISLVNLIAGREVIRELIQHDASVENITAELRRLLDGPGRDSVLAGYEQVASALETGESASDRTAELMVGYLKQ